MFNRREVPMRILKTVGATSDNWDTNVKMQCVCGRIFWSSIGRKSNVFERSPGIFKPQCPDCKGIHNDKDIPVQGSSSGKMFKACVAYAGNCRAQFMGDAHSMPEFLMGVSMAVLQMGLPMDGIEVKELTGEERALAQEEIVRIGPPNDELTKFISSLMTTQEFGGIPRGPIQ